MDSQVGLRVEPVGCVATVVLDDGDDASVYEVANGSEILRERRVGEDRYHDLHGSVVVVGFGAGGHCQSTAALILDLPEGRVQAVGRADLTVDRAGFLVALIEATTERGEPLVAHLSCRTPGRPPSILVH